MSFRTHMKPYIVKASTMDLSKDQTYYIRSMASALNKWFNEMDKLLKKSVLMVNGTIMTASVPSVSVPVNDILCDFNYKNPNITSTRFSNTDVQKALWCGDGNQSFINLFNLVGNKFINRYGKITSTSSVSNVMKPIRISIKPTKVLGLTIASFSSAGISFTEEMKSIGLSHTSENCTNMTPDTFLDLQDKWLSIAVKTCLPPPTPINGIGIVPAGTFTGTAVINYAAAII